MVKLDNLVYFAKELKIQTITEYVHSKEIYEIVYKLGIDEFQVYFSQPLEIENI